jgi:predicted nucleotidyltransferase
VASYATKRLQSGALPTDGDGVDRSGYLGLIKTASALLRFGRAWRISWNSWSFMKEIFLQFIDQAIYRLKEDHRICGLAIGGSWGSNEFDSFSDLDLIVVAKNIDYPKVFAERFDITKTFGDCISAFTGEHVGEPRLLICLFRNPLSHVDIKFVALKDFHDRIEDPHIAWERDQKLTEALQQSPARDLELDIQWIEDRIWTWIHYATVKAARGEIFETIGFLSFLREKVLAPMAMKLAGKPVRGVRRVEQRLPSFAKKLRRTLADFEQTSCFEAIRSSAELYKELRYPFEDKITCRTEAEHESLLSLSDAENKHK